MSLDSSLYLLKFSTMNNNFRIRKEKLLLQNNSIIVFAFLTTGNWKQFMAEVGQHTLDFSVQCIRNCTLNLTSTFKKQNLPVG